MRRSCRIGPHCNVEDRGGGVGGSRAHLPGAGVVEADAEDGGEEALDEDSPRWVGCSGQLESE